MINKNLHILLIFFLLFSTSYSEEKFFDFKTQNIEIKNDGDIIEATNGKVISKDKDFEIIADNFKFFNSLGILEINGNASILINNERLRIFFNRGTIDTNKNLLKAYEQIEFINQNRNIKIETEVIKFEYDKKFLSSDTNSKIYDSNKNIIKTRKFIYEIQNDLLKINAANITDKEDNILELSNAYFNTETNNLLGKDFILRLSNKNPENENEPRLKGNLINHNVDSSEITKGVFTSCKETDTCPSWELMAKKITHKKKKKIIEYENAILKFYDFPVLYLPIFSHPDPTVERQSGFLVPSIKSVNNNENYLKLPYYKVISENKDATFSPRIYNDNQLLLQTEYRSVGNKSKHLSDFSFKIDDHEKVKGHFFYKFNNKFDLDKFIDNNFALKFQKTSKDTYLRKNKISSETFSSNDILENSAKFNFEFKNSKINFETLAYEDLSKKDSDKYEYIFPSIKLNSNLANNTGLKGDLLFNSQLLNKKYNTNVLESININDLKFKSESKILKNGFYNNYEFLLKNTNSNSKNSLSFKNKENIYLSGLFQLNTSLPLKKKNTDFTSILNPKLALKISPDHTKDQRNEDIEIDVNNLFNLERIGDSSSIEGGTSLVYGAEYKIKRNNKQQDFLNINIANNLRLKENNDLPRNGQIDEKISSIFSNVVIKPHNNLGINYKNSIKNNFEDINYENLITELKINNLITTFDYLNQNELSSKNTYLSNKTEFSFDDSKSLIFSTRKNKTINLTEYYKLAYQYQNDCLAASIEYNKEYYTDRDIKPNEGIFFKLTILPFNKN